MKQSMEARDVTASLDGFCYGDLQAIHYSSTEGKQNIIPAEILSMQLRGDE